MYETLTFLISTMSSIGMMNLALVPVKGTNDTWGWINSSLAASKMICPDTPSSFAGKADGLLAHHQELSQVSVLTVDPSLVFRPTAIYKLVNLGTDLQRRVSVLSRVPL